MNGPDESIVESLLQCLKKYFDTVGTDSWLLPTEMAKQAQKTTLYN